MRLTFDVPGPAVPKGRPRVTSRGTFTPKRTVEYERHVAVAAHDAREGFAWPLGWRYAVTIHIVPLLPKKPGAKPRGGDVDNVTKSILDALNGVLWNDDDQVSVVHVYRYQATRRPGVKVEVIAWAIGDERWTATEWPEYQATRTPKPPRTKAPRAQRRKT